MKLKIDFHCHSRNSFDCLMSYGEIIETAKKRGLDGICICDHSYTDISESLKNDNDDFIIIPAVEFSTGKHHIIGMFLKEEPKVDLNDKLYSPFEQIVAETRRCGGICILAHPFERLQEGQDTVSRRVDEIMQKMDGIEIYNSRAPYKYSNANALARQKADELGTVCRTAGSDAHIVQEIGNAYCVVDTPSRSLEDIKNAVLNGKVEFFGRQCKRTHITKANLVRSKKLNLPFSNKIKIYLAFPIRAMKDLYDTVFKRKL